MDFNKLRRVIFEELSRSIDVKSIDLESVDSHKIRLEVISDSFKGMRLLKRINFVTEKIINIITNDLSDYSLIINPLTSNEKLNGISETTSNSMTEDIILNRKIASPDARI